MPEPHTGFSTEFSENFIQILQQRAIYQPDQVAFIFLGDGETESSRITYRELDYSSRTIAIQLQEMELSANRALLLYPVGLDYLIAFLGCLYAGVVAVPAYPPRNRRNTPRIVSLVEDAQASIALTTSNLLPKVQSLLAEKANFPSLHWLTTDNLSPEPERSWQMPAINSDSLAFLQYTSGSTGTPKGAMLSHGNLVHNAAITYQLMEHSADSVFVSWLPTYHDMGLIGGILQPLYGGFPCILMPPTAFLQRPYRWLKAISDYGGTTSGGPNFAYELCVQKISPEQRATLDLSSWSVAFNGAEPVRHSTLEQFASTFAACGFRQASFYPCYGMAEATLMVSGGEKAVVPRTKPAEKSALEQNRVVEAQEPETVQSLVSCGQSIPDQQIAIAHPQTFNRCAPGEIGEIWVSGPSVGHGYWQRPEQTEETFHAYLADTGEGPFLRTGDLGFLDRGELFITGRAKDLIVIRGRNLYPQDIELTAEQSHPALRSDSGAAFSVEVGNEERLVIVQELEFRQKPDTEEVIASIREAIAEAHEVPAYAVVLLKGGRIPKTSSGKIQRRACRQFYLAGELEAVGSSILDLDPVPETESPLQREDLLTVPHSEREEYLKQYLQHLITQTFNLKYSQLESQSSLSALGMDSLNAFELKNRIEQELAVTISITDLFDGVSLPQLAQQINDQLTVVKRNPLIPLTPEEKAQTSHPLSFAQQQLWFFERLAPGTPTYNITLSIQLQGNLDVRALQQSLNAIVQRHEILRTHFEIRDGQPTQIIHSLTFDVLPCIDLQPLPEAEAEAERLAKEQAQTPFDFSQFPLWRTQLLRLSPDRHQLVITLHHIIADGWSMGIFVRELATVYEAFSQGKSPSLSELPIQYVDFAHWQQQLDFQLQLNYWQQQLAGSLPVLNLPTDHPRPPVRSFRGARRSRLLPQDLMTAVESLSQQEGTTPFMTLLATFKTLLYRYTGQTDILVGSPTANRDRWELEGLIGCFINVLVLRTNLVAEPSFRDFLAQVRQVALEAYAHQALPFEQLVTELQPERDLSYHPLFQVMFAFQNVPQPTPNLSELSLTYQEIPSETAKFDLTLFIETTDSGTVATFEYNRDLFETGTIDRMLGHFQTLLEGIVAYPNKWISQLPILTEGERDRLLKLGQTTVEPSLFPQKFAEQAAQTPSAIAVACGEQVLTYQALNRYANQLAHYLQKQGVGPEVLVGVAMERSPDLLIGLLGILKAGGAYVPLDTTQPKQRLQLLLNDGQVPLLLTQKTLFDALPETQATVISLDSHWQTILEQSSEPPKTQLCPENLAYTIYTSGSTGTPKGVAIPHRGLANYLDWAKQAYPITEGKGSLVHSSLAVDMTITGMFLPLLAGTCVEFLPEQSLTMEALGKKLRNSTGYSLIKMTPAQLGWLSHQLSPPEAAGRSKALIIGGENLVSETIAFWQEATPETQLVNEYGPTETVVGCCVYFLPSQQSHAGSIPIGQPITNTELCILDAYLQPVPIGIAGELYIGGAGLARGYLNRPELTAERFLPHPFSQASGNRLYRTGDLARYQADGTIEFLGRIDDQVKVRGFRIELGEIEAALEQHEAVQESVVIAQGEQLVAYLVSSAQLPNVSDLRAFLQETLPEYMIPTHFVPLTALPLSNSGKVDYQALPSPQPSRPELAVSYQAPQTQLEEQIAAIWQEVLGVEQVGIHDNFFDLGGHSLLVVQVREKLHERLQQNLSVVDLFEHPTIHALATYCTQSSPTEADWQFLEKRVQGQKRAFARQKQLRRKRKR
ncbi:MAG: amino acid adenylation domain-containing protein [Cyanobacteria bacterium]|nr:amino acid adenylation domain-containing protein [Cyanobacteria bacterium GSL.Bin1]